MFDFQNFLWTVHRTLSDLKIDFVEALPAKNAFSYIFENEFSDQKVTFEKQNTTSVFNIYVANCDRFQP